MLDRQQRVNEAGELVARLPGLGRRARAALATIGEALLREDRDFHTIQMVEAAFRQHQLLAGTPMRPAAGRGGALPRGPRADRPGAGADLQIARRLHNGENLFEEDGVA